MTDGWAQERGHWSGRHKSPDGARVGPVKIIKCRRWSRQTSDGTTGLGEEVRSSPLPFCRPSSTLHLAPETGHPRLHYRLICIGTPQQPPGAFQSNLNSFDFRGNLRLDKFLRVSSEDLSLLFKELECLQPGPRKTPPPFQTEKTKGGQGADFGSFPRCGNCFFPSTFPKGCGEETL